MLTADQFTQRMQQVQRLVAELAEQSESPASVAAADLVRTLSELHAGGLERILALVRAGGEAYQPLLERFAQDDLIRSLLLFHNLHPIDLPKRLEEAVDNLRPLVESYGGRVSIVRASQEHVLLRLNVSSSTGPSPVAMLKELLEQAILVAAPDVAEVRFEEGDVPFNRNLQLPIVS